MTPRSAATLGVSVAAAALFILAALGLKAAVHAQLITQADSVQALQVMMGLGLAFYGNFIPKRLGAPRGPTAESLRQNVLRVAGWSFTLGGLAYAGFSAFLPTPLGADLAMASVAAAMVATLINMLACMIESARERSNTSAN